VGDRILSRRHILPDRLRALHILQRAQQTEVRIRAASIPHAAVNIPRINGIGCRKIDWMCGIVERIGDSILIRRFALARTLSGMRLPIAFTCVT